MTGNQLKILALITMTIDHIGVMLLPQCLVLRIIGRLTYPVFAYMIAEGCFYTHQKARYLGLIFLLDLACQLVYFFALGSLEQCILTSFVLSIITIYALQLAAHRRDFLGAISLLGALALDAFVCFVVPDLLAGTDFSIDYGFFGILLPVLCYAPRVFAPSAPFSRRRWYMLACCAIGLVLVSWAMRDWLGGIQWFSLATLALLATYNGKRGAWHLKYLFYIYYPAHLVAIWSLSLLF